MSIEVSKKEIGQRISELRKAKGLSQEELALKLKLSRPSLAQIELGNRNIDIIEMKNIAVELGFSIDEFLSGRHETLPDHTAEDIAVYVKPAERVAQPALKNDKFKEVLLYILERCAGKPNIGLSELHKLLYFSDFNHFELYEEHLTGLIYKKLPNGPVSMSIDTTINQMIEEGYILRVKTKYSGTRQIRYLPLKKADLTCLMASEKEVIDIVINQLGDFSGTAMSNYVLKDMPFLASGEGDEINYELAFYRETPYSSRNYHDESKEL